MKIVSLKRIFAGHNLYAKIETDEGIYGIGEGTINSREAAAAAVLEAIAPVVVGQDPFNIEHIWQDVLRGTFWRGGPVLMSALSAVDSALWDIKGKALNTPVYNLLGGKCRNKIRMYAHCGGKTPDELCQNAENILKRGFTVLRICPHDLLSDGFYEPGKQTRLSVAFMKALRAAVGDDIEIIFECHTRLTPVRAIEVANAIAEYRPVFIEDPIRADSPESFRVIRSHTNVPLGTGEKFGALWDYKTLIEEDLIDYLRTDICNCGGITSMRKIAAYGESHYIEMAPHGLPGAVGTMAALHLDTATPNFYVQESGLYSDIGPHLEIDAEFKDGFYTVGDSPGLGVKFDESKCAPYSYREHPHWRREDGTVQDW
ncbi:MAG: mandelate racemase/muconate lactonizing enzyme family protein, partial [Oscillospiraceae bacterium]|nr:mandelate racemase/muconate lactonizing enzyme family protein [Oscillospiraceae bacterium]